MIPGIIPLLPLIITGATTITAMVALCVKRSHRLIFGITLSGVAAAFGSLFPASGVLPQQIGLLFIFDGFSLFYSGLLLSTGFAIAILSFDYLEERGPDIEEYYILLLGAMVGALALVSARHFVSFFVALEILAISLYPLIAYQRSDVLHAEAGLKYLILSGASSAFLVFGMAMIYGLTGSMEFPGSRQLAEGVRQNQPIILAGMVFFMIGIGFKLGVVPFHMWSPDVYEGAPAPITAFIATISKGAVLCLLLRYFTDVDFADYPQLMIVFTAIAVASMLAGNLLALFQKNIKRLLAYSSIAHFGYLLVAFLSAEAFRAMAVTYYLAAYFVATVGAFGVITLLSGGRRDADSLEDYEGLFQRRPWVAGVFALMLLSLAGMPLTAGFIGKVYVVAAGVNSILWVPVAALVTGSAIGIFYYLRVITAMFHNPPPVPSISWISPLKGEIVVGSLLILLVWWGIYPLQLIRLIRLLMTGQYR